MEKHSFINLTPEQTKAACVYAANMVGFAGLATLKDVAATLLSSGMFAYTLFNLYVAYKKFKDEQKTKNK